MTTRADARTFAAGDRVDRALELGMRKPPRLLIIDPATEVAEEQGVEEILMDWQGDHTLLKPVLEGNGPDPSFGYDVDGVVVFGSASSVHDPSDWLTNLSDWLRPIIAGQRRIPLFGICFGHQLIAHLAGGRVGYLREDKSKLVGYEHSTTTVRLFNETRTIRAIVSHREEVKEIPKGFNVVGHRPNSTRDVLEHEELPVYSVQYHPEARDRFAKRIGLDMAGLDDQLLNDSRSILAAFRREVLKHSNDAE